MPFPDGHFYSPICDTRDLEQRRERIWGETAEILGIDFNERSHVAVLQTLFPRYFPFYDYPDVLEETGNLKSFYTKNTEFGWLDSRLLFVLLNAWKPGRMIEVGSGFSSLLTADVNARFLSGSMHFSCIEPYPRQFLKSSIDGLNELIVEKVEDLPFSLFEGLRDGDVLFIDSSHVAKTGSDVNYLFFEILPRLKPGVRVHVHDVFLPREYPEHWVLKENRSWNEQYLLRALLMHSNWFEVLFGCTLAVERYRPLVARALGLAPEEVFGGSSFWIRRTKGGNGFLRGRSKGLWGRYR
jgi:hypothetical protein